MEIKLFEIRDKATFVPVMAVSLEWTSENLAEEFLLRRAGFSRETLAGDPDHRMIQMTVFATGKSNYDPYAWGGRTYPVAHRYLTNNWDSLISGDVIDVEFILGERTEPKKSERFGTIDGVRLGWGE